MKKHYLLISIWVTTLFFLSIIMVSKSHAGVGSMNRPEPELRTASEQAGAFVFKGFSTIYQAFEQLELGKVDDANTILQIVAKPFFEKEALGRYEYIKQYDLKNPRDLKKLPSKQLEIIQKDFSRFQFSVTVQIPKNTKDLSEATVRAILDFTKVLDGTKFVGGDLSKNRDLVRTLSEMIFNLTTLGLSISNLASPLQVNQ